MAARGGRAPVAWHGGATRTERHCSRPRRCRGPRPQKAQAAGAYVKVPVFPMVTTVKIWRLYLTMQIMATLHPSCGVGAGRAGGLIDHADRASCSSGVSLPACLHERGHEVDDAEYLGLLPAGPGGWLRGNKWHLGAGSARRARRTSAWGLSAQVQPAACLLAGPASLRPVSKVWDGVGRLNWGDRCRSSQMLRNCACGRAVGGHRSTRSQVETAGWSPVAVWPLGAH